MISHSVHGSADHIQTVSAWIRRWYRVCSQPGECLDPVLAVSAKTSLLSVSCSNQGPSQDTARLAWIKQSALDRCDYSTKGVVKNHTDTYDNSNDTYTFP